MAGIRISHPYLRNVKYNVETPLKYPTANSCNFCKQYHTYKTIHVPIGGDGTGIVSPEIWELLKTVPGTELTQVEVIENPPPSAVGAVDMPVSEAVIAPLAEPTRQRFYVPGISKYKSADIMLTPFKPFIEKAMEEMEKRDWMKKRLVRRLFVPR